MKLHIEDAYGSSIIGAWKADGSLAVEGEDYALWTGAYHKNGKWSYTEGGVMTITPEIYFLINLRSTHRSADNRKRFAWLRSAAEGPPPQAMYYSRYEQADGSWHMAVDWIRRWDEEPEFPKIPCAGFPEAVYLAAINNAKPNHRKVWEKAAKFGGRPAPIGYVPLEETAP